MPGLWSFKSQIDLYEFKKVRPALLWSSYPTQREPFLVKINADMYYALPGLVMPISPNNVPLTPSISFDLARRLLDLTSCHQTRPTAPSNGINGKCR